MERIFLGFRLHWRLRLGCFHEVCESSAEGRHERVPRGETRRVCRRIVAEQVLWRPQGPVNRYEPDSGQGRVEEHGANAGEVEDRYDGEDRRPNELLHLTKGSAPDCHWPRVDSHYVQPHAAEN